AVALVGSIVDCVNADDTTAIDAGGWVEANDNAVGGTVSEAVLSVRAAANRKPCFPVPCMRFWRDFSACSRAAS
ncbi:MAG: hypothetical protein PHE27_07875, partial [Alphaproteobacteria bacterium]|nr:hypothetical protein [Alphaproteobacteria bacterium]